MRATEGVEDPSADIHGEAFGRERRARDVAAEVFELAAAIRGTETETRASEVVLDFREGHPFPSPQVESSAALNYRTVIIAACTLLTRSPVSLNPSACAKTGVSIAKPAGTERWSKTQPASGMK